MFHSTNQKADASPLNPRKAVCLTLLLGCLFASWVAETFLQLISFSHRPRYFMQCHSHLFQPVHSVGRGRTLPPAAVSSVIEPHKSFRAACEFTAQRKLAETESEAYL